MIYKYNNINKIGDVKSPAKISTIYIIKIVDGSRFHFQLRLLPSFYVYKQEKSLIEDEPADFIHKT